MQLDVLLREIDLAAVAGDLPGARSALERTNAIWGSISTKPPLRGSPAARTFDRQLADLDRRIAAGRPQPVQRSALAALEGVDALEVVFESRGKSAP